jgi:SAM-dependent methyltransferase
VGELLPVSIEQEYYEDVLFWDDENIRESDRIRVVQTSDIIPNDVQSIVDVGCGNGIFVNYLAQASRNFKHLLGIDRSSIALRFVKADKVRANIDALPFRTGEFDLVACLEVIEHLPIKTYDLGLRELCRVSNKYVLISVPNNESLRASLIECPKCFSRFNPDYHMRSFESKSMEALLSEFHYRCINLIYLGESVNYLKPPKIRMKKNPFPMNIPCPVCGYYLAGSTRSYPSEMKSSLKIFLKKFWPRTSHFTWIAGLYEREK